MSALHALQRLARATLVLLALSGPGLVFSASEHEALVGMWRLEVQDKRPARDFEIQKIRPGADGKAEIVGRYGWTGERLRRVPAATFDSTPGAETIELTTPTQAQVRLKKVNETTYDGQLTNTTGRVFGARLRLVSNHDGSAAAAAEADDTTQAAAAESAPPQRVGGKTVYKPGAKILFLYMGGNDCPPCREWRATEFLKLKAMPEFADMSFHFVVKAVQSPVPVGWLSEELKPYGPALLEASAGRGGSSQNAFIVDGRIADYWFGSRDATEIADMVRAVRQGKPLPGTPCLKRDVRRQCVEKG